MTTKFIKGKRAAIKIHAKKSDARKVAGKPAGDRAPRKGGAR